MSQRRRAVLLDRDGVLNYNRRDHVKSPDELVLIPGAAEAVGALNRAGWVVVMVSNQSGVGLGLYPQEALEAITAKLTGELEAAGGQVDGIYYCLHAPDAGCDCRKPAPGLALQAARDHGLDLQRSYFVGDKAADIACGQAAGMRTVLVETGLPEERPDPAVARPDHVASDVSGAVAWILQRSDS